MPYKFITASVTYATATEESARDGEYAEAGHVVYVGGYREPIEHHTRESEPFTHVMLSAREAARLIEEHDCSYSVSTCGTRASFYAAEPQDKSWLTGECTEMTVHVRGPQRLLRALVRHVNPRHVHV